MLVEIHDLDIDVESSEGRRKVLQPTLEEQRAYLERLLTRYPSNSLFKEILAKIDAEISTRDLNINR